MCIPNLYKVLLTLLITALLSACQIPPMRGDKNLPAITETLEESVAISSARTEVRTPPEVAAALLPPMRADLSMLDADLEPRFDIAVNATPASEFFMSLVRDTPLNMVVHPDVTGTISISLQDVTLDEVMGTARDVYGYRYRRSGNTYQVFPARIRTQIFKVDYLDVMRNGRSRTRFSSGQANSSDSSSGGGGSNTSTAGSSGGSTPGGATGYVTGAVVDTDSESDFWKDLRTSLDLLIGDEAGRKVVVHPQTGVIVAHAMPEELRDVEDFLKTIENSARRLVILEAKILEVNLNDNFQAGINWNALLEFGDDKSILFGHSGGGTVFDTGATALAGTTVPLVRGSRVLGFDTTALGGVFTIDANLKDFNALIELLKLQGDVQVLSSPRISTVNNQKAVIKVGQDEYFVTDVNTDTDISDGVSNQSVDVTLTPFFSGVALDVIPQISDDDSIILHIHPAVSEVREKVKEISTSSTEELSIPLALSTIRESDSVIRASSGQIIVLGGLMRDSVRDDESRTPVLGDVPGVGHMFRHKRETLSKSELVILLRPIVINNDQEWNGQLRETAQRFQNLRIRNSQPAAFAGQPGSATGE